MPTGKQRRVGTYISDPETVGRLVAALRTGSSVLITELSESMEDGDCTPDVVKATLANLRLELVPENPLDAQSSEDEWQNASRAVASILLLTRIAETCRMLPHIAKFTVPLVLASLEGITCWGGIALNLALPYDQPQRADFNSRYNSVARMFCLLMGMDKRLLNGLRSSQALIQLALKIWTTFGVYDGEKATCGPWEYCEIYAALVLLEYILTIEDSRKLLFEVICMHDLEESFSLATVHRAKQVSEAVASSQDGADGFEVYAIEFVQATGIGIHLTADVTIRQALRDAGYLTQLTKMLNDISISLVDRGAPNCLKKLFGPLMSIATAVLADDGPSSVRQNICDLLAGGWLHAFVRIMTNGQADEILGEETFDKVRKRLETISAWVVYPDVCKALFESQQETGVPDVDKMNDIPQIRDVWKPFWSMVLTGLGVWSDMRGDFFSDMCDNPSCDRPKKRPRASSRQCSGCGTVVYCSEECQRADWEEWHREECPPARALQLARRKNDSVYDHKSRAFHAKYVEKLYQRHAQEIAAKAEEHRRPIFDFPPIFDCRSLQDSTEIWDLEKLEAEGQSAETTELTQRQFKDSLEDLVGMTMYPPYPTPCNVRLAQGIFQQGTESSIFLLVFLREVEGQFEATYSVPHFRGCDIEP